MNRHINRILIADDEVGLTDEWSQLFRMEGIECDSVHQPWACLDLLKKKGPGYYQAMLLDIKFPVGTEGIKIFPDIQEIDPELPVVYVSAWADLEKLERGIRMGAHLMVPKPIDFPVLLQTVYSAVIRKEFEKEKFFYSRLIVHEMKNRAFGAQAELNQLMETVREPTILKGLERVHRSIDQIANRAQRILALNPADRQVSADVKECVAWALMKMGSEPLASNKDVKDIEEPDIVGIPGNLPSVAIRDEVLIDVLCELFGNALRAMRTTGGKIKVQASVTTEDIHVGSGVEVRIRDYGPGMSPETKATLFDIPGYSRLSRSALSGDAIHGLGLYYCRRVIENCGGWIWHEDPTDGPGAVFAFRLSAG